VANVSFDWKSAIVQIVYWKQIAHEHDKLNAFPWHLPKVAATEAQIVQAEREINTPFPKAYREFLKHANGWKGFRVSDDLFGTEDFLNGKAEKCFEFPEVEDYLFPIGLQKSDVIPIGASEFDLDKYFVVPETNKSKAGTVLWLAGSEAFTFSNFEAFVEEMIATNEYLARQLQAGRFQ
jgi:SMI1 / KNR4 family (SUKH-1)